MIHAGLSRTLAAALAVLTVTDPTAGRSQSLEETQQRLSIELGAPTPAPIEEPARLREMLPGSWVIMPWSAYSELDPGALERVCGIRRVTIAPDLTLTMAFGDPQRPGSVPGRIELWYGRMASLVYDEDAFLNDFLRLPEEMRDGPAGFAIRRSVRQMLILSPRGSDVLVGYSMLDAGAAVIFQRCPA